MVDKHEAEAGAPPVRPSTRSRLRDRSRFGAAKSRRGVAIMMVVLILAALISIAGPFAISMHLYERSSRHFRDTVRARLAAEGAVAHAISCLRRTEDAAEEEARYGAPWNTPDVDTQEELDVYFSFGRDAARALKEADVAFDDPKGIMWSANVEDEQGKINLISVAPRVLGNMLRSDTLAADVVPGASFMVLNDASLFDNGDDPASSGGEVCLGLDKARYRKVSGDRLEGLSWTIDRTSGIRRYKAGTLVYDAAAKKIADAGARGDFKTLFELKEHLTPRDFEVIKPYVTVNSYRDTSEGWLTRVEIKENFSAPARQFRVRSVAGFGQGARIRFVVTYRDTGETTYHDPKRIYWARQRVQWGQFRLYGTVGFRRPDNCIVHVQAEQFHPVNVNTASPSVLTSLLAGLGEGRQRVTRFEAETIADYIYYYVRRDETQVPDGRPVGSQADFREMMDRFRKSGWLEDGLSSAKLEAIVQDATATVCFKAYGNFTIEAAGSVNTPAGEESARHVVRQLLTMPVESGGEWSLSSQKDFDEQIQRLVGPKTDTFPFTKPPTTGTALGTYKQGIDPRSGRDKHGYVTLSTGWAGGEEVEHFDERSRRWQGAYVTRHGAAVARDGVLRRVGSTVFQKSGDVVKPFTFEGWFRVEGGGAGNALGLAAGEENQNGIRLSYTTAGVSGNPEYILTVADACADQGTADPWLGPAEFRFEAPQIESSDWYHLAMQVKGTSPGEALVWVDGVVSRGNPSSYRPGTRLAQSLSLTVAKVGANDALLTEGDTVVVDDTSDFPDFGAIIIDSEVMEYQTKTPTTFEECRRARRYTHLADHQTGAVVTPYGYSVGLKTDLFPGTGELASDLGPNPVSAIEEKLIPNPAGGDDIPDKLAADATEIPLVDATDFQKSGIVRIGNEYVLFEDRKDNLLLDCTRGYDLGSHNMSDPQEFDMDGKTTVRQISIACTDMNAYTFEPERKTPGPDPHKKTGGKYYHYASVKHEDTSNPDPYGVEWFRLEHQVQHGGITYVLGAYRNLSGTHVRNNMNWRGQLGTTKGELKARESVLPVVQLEGPQCGHWDSPRETEDVTPVQGDRAWGSTLRITHSYCWQRKYWTPNSCYYVFRASFDKPITGSTYTAGQGRILKFPSGEFMRDVPSVLKVGGSNGAGFNGAIDELRTGKNGTVESAVLATRFEDRFPPFTVTEPIWYASSATSLTIMAEMATDGACVPHERPPPAVPGSLNSHGVVRIGDELIWFDSKITENTNDHIIPFGREQRTDEKHCPYVDYTKHSNGCRSRMQMITLDGCIRGILGTNSLNSDHAAGARVTFFEGIPLTRLANALRRAGDQLSIEDDLKFPAEGYAVITDPSELAEPGEGEIVGWTSGGGKSFEGCRYFRGRFGTPEQDHLSDDFCQLLPFRYWDRWNYDFDDDTELAYFQCSYSARDAYWHEIEWQESGYTGGAASDNVRLRIVCRFDGSPEWNERPTNSQGGLWEFSGGGRQYFRSAGGGPMVADSIEVRAYWEYINGAWDVDVNDWKRNVRLDNLTVTFGNPLIVRKVDLLDY